MMEMQTGMPGALELLILLLPILTLVVGGLCLVFPFWRIFAKAGFPGALALLMVVPPVNIVLLFFLAFAQWPNRVDKTVAQPPST